MHLKKEIRQGNISYEKGYRFREESTVRLDVEALSFKDYGVFEFRPSVDPDLH